MSGTRLHPTPSATGSFPIPSRERTPPNRRAQLEDIVVTVTRREQLPVLAVIGNKTVTERTPHVHATATDPTPVGSDLLYGPRRGRSASRRVPSSDADNGPARTSHDHAGHRQRGSFGSDFEAVTVTVNDTVAWNRCPVLAAIGN
jgi:hypothetical protein